MKTTSTKITSLPIFRIIDRAAGLYAKRPSLFDDLSGALLMETGEDDETWGPALSEVNFYCGPALTGTSGGTLSDSLSCYDWMETRGLDAIVAKYGAEIEIGAAENLHIITKIADTIDGDGDGFSQQELDNMWRDLVAALDF